MELASLTYPEVQEVLQRGAVALWPIGSTEAHGPHLPLDTDVLIAAESARRAVPLLMARLKLQGVLLPPLAFTVTEYAGPFSGTISIPKETATAYARDVALGAAKQGFRAVCLVNAHLEPAHRFALRDAVKAAAARAPCPVVLADPCDRRWVSSLTEEFRSGSCHAGQYESSLVMAARPGGVRDDLRRALPDNDIDLVAKMQAGLRTFDEMGADQAYFGHPAAATPAEGEASYAVLADIVAQVVAEALDGAR